MTSLQMADAVFLGNMKTILALILCVGAGLFLQYSVELFAEWEFNRKMKKQEKEDAS